MSLAAMLTDALAQYVQPLNALGYDDVSVVLGLDAEPTPWLHSQEITLPTMPSHKEDDPNDDDGDDGRSGGSTIMDARDVADAAAAFDRLLAAHAARPEASEDELPTAASISLAAELGPVLRDFNVQIVDMALGRKERFNTSALFTLLDIIAGKKTSPHSGHVFLNGHQVLGAGAPRDSNFSRLTACKSSAERTARPRPARVGPERALTECPASAQMCLSTT